MSGALKRIRKPSTPMLLSTFFYAIIKQETILGPQEFRTGMEIAHGNGFHWVRLLGQDGTVCSGCLTELLRHDEGELGSVRTYSIVNGSISAYLKR
jgi:hypothetical protein